MLNQHTTLQLFPFSVVFDAELRILMLGRTFLARCPDAIDTELNLFITPVRWTGGFTLPAIRQHIGKMLLLSVGRMGVRFKGEIVQLSDDRFLIVCSPQIDEVEKIKSLGLTFQDFARFDTTIDSVFLVQAARQSQEETLASARRLRESEARYRILIEQHLLIMVAFDEKRQIVFGNPAWTSFAGEESIGKPADNFIAPASLAQWNATLDALIKQDQATPDHTSFSKQTEVPDSQDFVLVAESGHTIIAEGFIGYHRRTETDGENLYFSMFTDVTENRNAARVLEETRQKMMQSQKMNALGRLAGGIAHDFNNLLGVIMSASCILLEDLEEDSPLREDAEMILNSCESGAKLSSQLMTFSHNKRTTPEVLNPAEVTFNLSQVLDTVVGENIRISFEHADPDANIHIDRLEFEQVLITTCVNAREAMPTGGNISISVSRPATGKCRLTIADQGCGMSPEVAQQACDPFFSTKSEGNHPGLGLAVVYGVANRNSADLQIDSEPDKGTKVHLTFPEAEMDIVKPREQRSQSRPQPQRMFDDDHAPHVLLVEDREELRLANARSLRRMGCQVTAVEGVQSAFDVLRGGHSSPDVLVTDVQLGDGNGADLAERCVEEGLLSRVLLVTGYARKEHLESIAHRHGWTILMKPFTPRQLGDVLTTTMRSN